MCFQAINCYHALAALGDAMNIDNMKQLGQIWLAMEITSVKQYYHVRLELIYIYC